MINKKGFELPANFFVVIILSLVTIGMGIYLVNLFFGEAENIRKNLDTQTEKEIQRLLFEGKRVVIPINSKTIKKGKSDVFGLGVLNNKVNSNKFTIRLENNKLILLDKTTRTTFTKLEYIDTLAREIKSNEQLALPLVVRVPRGAALGTYIINVYVCDALPPAETCNGKVDATNADNNEELFDDSIHKVLVKVE